MAEECVFCKMAAGKIPVSKIYENESFFSILDLNQDVKGHALVISKKHFETTLDLPVVLGRDFLDCVKSSSFKILKNEKAEGFNVLGNNFSAAGQAVKHFHIHIFPRKSNDGFKVFG